MQGLVFQTAHTHIHRRQRHSIRAHAAHLKSPHSAISRGWDRGFQNIDMHTRSGGCQQKARCTVKCSGLTNDQRRNGPVNEKDLTVTFAIAAWDLLNRCRLFDSDYLSSGCFARCKCSNGIGIRITQNTVVVGHRLDKLELTGSESRVTSGDRGIAIDADVKRRHITVL